MAEFAQPTKLTMARFDPAQRVPQYNNKEMQIYSVLSFPRKREPCQIKRLDSRFRGNDELICTSINKLAQNSNLVYLYQSATWMNV